MNDDKSDAPDGIGRRDLLHCGVCTVAMIGLAPRAVAATVPSDSVTDMSAVDLRAAIASRQLSVKETMTAYLARIDALNPQFNAIVSSQDPTKLLEQASAADAACRACTQIGPLFGFPQAPKDSAATHDIVTTFGSRLLRDHRPKADGIIVERARRAGAIIIGKTNVPEFALGSQTYNQLFGTTLNAWNRRLTAGGSSGGAATAVSLRLLPVADGSDMMGSIRNPAGWNNLVGFRPSLGRVPWGPTEEIFFQQLATDGPIGRSVADVALLLSVQAGRDDRAPLSLKGDPKVFAGNLERDVRGTRIGFLGDLGGHLPMEEGVLDLCRNGLRQFEACGCRVEPATATFDLAALWTAWVALRSHALAGGLAAFYADPGLRNLMKPEAIWEIETGLSLTSQQLFRAARVRSEWYRALIALFKHFDYLILPTAQLFAFDAKLHWPRAIAGRAMDSYHRWMEVTIYASLAGLPTLAVPAGFDWNGRAMGLQIIGKPQADLAVLQIGHAYEQAGVFSRLRPTEAGPMRGNLRATSDAVLQGH